MSEKRRDNKGRILRDGEYQRSDGKYEYKYVDATGVRRSIYSWKLVETDKVPDGKRNSPSLRDLVRKTRRDAEDGINSFTAYRTTLNSFFSDEGKESRELCEPRRENQDQLIYDRFYDKSPKRLKKL